MGNFLAELHVAPASHSVFSIRMEQIPAASLLQTAMLPSLKRATLSREPHDRYQKRTCTKGAEHLPNVSN